MKLFLTKWILASLIMPAYVFFLEDIARKSFELVLIFWPSSIFLMSLGASERPTSDIVYVWSMSVAINMIVYFLLGLLIYFVKNKYLNRNNI